MGRERRVYKVSRVVNKCKFSWILNMWYFLGGILTLLGVKCTKQLTPREQTLYNFAATVKKQYLQYRKRVESFKLRYDKAIKFHENFSEVMEEMDSATTNFIYSQLRNHRRSKYKYSFTLDDKLLALSLQKRSAKTYKFLSKLFILPSKETLRSLINGIDMSVGIHTHSIEMLSSKIQSMDEPKQFYCVLLFDEIRLTENLEYNVSEDSVCGFVNDESETFPEFANSAMVWQLQGIHGTPWKQPVAFTLNRGTCSWTDICTYYKKIVRKCINVGIHVVASICDQGGTNIRALSHMIEMSRREAFQRNEELRHNVIMIDDQKVVVLYDPPHLLKAMRNNLLVKTLTFEVDGTRKIADWKHVELTYQIDRSFNHRRILTKLSDLHVFEKKMKKMKVSYAAQIISHTLASVMSLMSRNRIKSECGEKQLPAEAEDTAELLFFMNDLFDSVNNRCLSTSDEEIVVKWNNMLRILKTMKFTVTRKAEKQVPPVLTNLILTLENFILLQKYLRQLGFKNFNPRLFNQDALENFFGQIRQHGMRNTRPDCSNFQHYYKSLHIDIATHDAGFNCEKTGSNVLINLKNLIQHKIPSSDPVIIDLNLNSVSNVRKTQPIASQFINVAVKMIQLQCVELSCNCENCNSLRDNKNSNFVNFVTHITNFTYEHLPHILHIPHLTKQICRNIILTSTDEYFNCIEAKDIIEQFLKKYITHILRKYIKEINQILKGKLTLQICDKMQKKAMDVASKK